MNDYLITATSSSGNARAFAASTKNTVESARLIHETSPVVTAALGRTLTGALIMGAMMKNDNDLLTIQIKGDGPMQGIVVTADSKGNVKGYPYVNNVDIPLKSVREDGVGKLDVSGAVGSGYMSVIMDVGLKEPYIGKVPLITSEIAEDFANYFVLSEQTPSAVSLGVLVDVDRTVKSSGGIIVQMLPGADDKTADILNKRMIEMPPVSSLLESGKTLEEILESIFYDMDLNINEKRDVTYHCNCTRDKVEKALIAIGKKEIEQILETDEKAEINCHFCNENYLFDKKDLNNILGAIGSNA